MSKINRYVFLISILICTIFLNFPQALAEETIWEKLRERWIEKKSQISDNRELDDYHFSLVHDGITRKYNVHLPPSYNKSIPAPVVIYLHGGGGSIKSAYKDEMDKKSDKFGFILVIPAGTGPIPDRLLRWNGGTWDGSSTGGYPVKNNIDDVGFISKVIDEVSKEFIVDQNRVYATGISNGGIMSYRLACELSDKIAAVAAVAPPAVPSNCTPERPISIMHIHGTADPLTPFYGGEGGIRKVSFQAQSARDMVGFWIKTNASSTNFTTSYEKGKAKCISYGSGKDGTYVEFCTIEDGGHTWPSGSQYSPVDKIGPVSYDISFDQIWEFFKKVHLPLSKERRKHWFVYEDNPVIKVNDAINGMIWNDPCVIKEGSIYRMWLSGGTGIGINHVRIYEATSNDGIVWSISPRPLIGPSASGEWDDEKIETPSVVKVGDQYHLYYSGFKTGDGPGCYQIGHAISQDGINWEKDPKNPVISYHKDATKWGFYQAAEPAVVYNPKDKKIYLYYVTLKFRDGYKGENSHLSTMQGICLATSNDGSSFVHYDADGDGNRDAVLVQSPSYPVEQDYRGYSTPYVLINHQGEFHMFHDVVKHPKRGNWRQVALAHAVSKNGLSFVERSSDILEYGEEDWTEGEIRAPSVLENENEFVMWYAGNSRQWHRLSGIGIAWYSTKDN